MILPTMACQASCSYCFARKTGSVMTRAVAEKALDFIARTAPEGKDFRITFHGGEPLLAGKDFYRWILPEIRGRFSLRAHLGIQSNLWAMDEEFADLFVHYRVHAGTSADGPRDMCDAQRGEGYHDRVRAGERLLERYGIPAGEICTFTGSYAHRAAEVYRASAHPYSIHGAVPPLGSEADGRYAGTEDMRRILTDSYEAYRSDPSRSRITTIDAMAKGVLTGEGQTCTFFDCLGKFAAIAPDGGIFSCQRFAGCDEFRLGNVTDDPDEARILTSPAYRRLLEKQSGTAQACGGCAHYDYCRGGCLYNAFAADRPADPYCEAYRAVFDRIGVDMAGEMADLLIGKRKEAPVLAMAGDRPHPYDLRVSREAMIRALERGKQPAEESRRVPVRHPETRLNKFYLHITFRCPLRCAHCYAEGGTRRSDELSAARFAELVSQAARAGFRSVVVTGGEPLSYPAFDELAGLLSGADRAGTRLILRSSFGFEIPPERMKRICALFDEIVVSVDGDRETHDARRGGGSYDCTVRNLEAACGIGASGRLALCAVMGDDLCTGAPGESVRALARRLGIRKVRMRPVLPLGRAAGMPEENAPLCPEEPGADFRLRRSCGLGQNLYIEPDGAVYPCYAWRAPDKRLGSLAEEDLDAVLARGELYGYCLHDVDTNEKCRVCEVRYLCGGICKAWLRDRENVDSGDFDCTARKKYYTRLAEEIGRGTEEWDCSNRSG